MKWLKEFEAFKLSHATFYRIISYFNETNYIIEKNSQMKMINKICNSNLLEEKIDEKADIKMATKDENNEKIMSNCGVKKFYSLDTCSFVSINCTQ